MRLPYSNHWKTGVPIEVELFKLEWDEGEVTAHKVEEPDDIFIDDYSYLQQEHVSSMASSIKEDIDIKKNLG